MKCNIVMDRFFYFDADTYFKKIFYFCLSWVLGTSIFYFFDSNTFIKLSEVAFSPDNYIENKPAAFLKIAFAPCIMLLFLAFPKVMRKRILSLKNLPIYIVFFVLHILIYENLFKLFSIQEGEDGFFENLTAILSFISCLIFFICGLRGFRFAFFLSVGWFLFAMEEISWGQRIFNLQVSPYFYENNYQQEINLHNFFNYSLNSSIGYVIFNFLLLSFFTWFSELKLFEKFYNSPTISELIKISDSYSIWIIPLFLIPAKFLGPTRGQEIIEQQWSFLGIILSFLLLIKIIKNEPNSI